jgi:hypothetical protein
MILGGWTVVANQTGNLIIDIKTSNYNDFPIFSSIVTGVLAIKPNISGLIKNNSVNLSGWTTLINKGDFIQFHVDTGNISQFNINITGLKYV